MAMSLTLGLAAALHMQPVQTYPTNDLALHCQTRISIDAKASMFYVLEGVGHVDHSNPDARLILDRQSVRTWVTMERDGEDTETYLEAAAGQRIHQDLSREVYAVPAAERGLFFYFDRWNAKISVRHYLPDGKIAHSAARNGLCIILE